MDVLPYIKSRKEVYKDLYSEVHLYRKVYIV